VKKLAFVTAAILLFRAVNSLAQETRDHLEPLSSEWSFPTHKNDLPAIVHTVFHEAWDADVLAWSYNGGSVLGSTGDHMTLLRKSGQRYEIVALQSPVMLWAYTTASEHVQKVQGYSWNIDPSRYTDVKLSRCQIDVAKPLADRIIAAWHGALMATRYYESPQVPVPDGSWTIFSMKYNDQELQGVIADAAEDHSLPSALLKLNWDMAQFCDDKTDALRSELGRDLADLEELHHGKQNERPH
jgi:hypothetical protein